MKFIPHDLFTLLAVVYGGGSYDANIYQPTTAQEETGGNTGGSNTGGSNTGAGGGSTGGNTSNKTTTKTTQTNQNQSQIGQSVNIDPNNGLDDTLDENGEPIKDTAPGLNSTDDTATHTEIGTKTTPEAQNANADGFGSWWIFIALAVLAVIVGTISFLVAKKRKNKQQAGTQFQNWQ